MSITKKMMLAGMFAFAFTMGMEAKAADSIVVTPPTPTVDTAVVVVPGTEVALGNNSIEMYDADAELKEMGLNPDNFDFAGKTGREINEEMYPLEISQGD